MLSLLLALPSAAGLVGPELLHRLGPARGVVPAPSRRSAHVVVLAVARWAAPTIGESQQQLHAVQRNASCLSGAARPREDPCDGAGWWDRGAQSARSPVAKSVWLARSASAFPSIWARGPAVRNTIAAPVGAFDAECRAWRGWPQLRGCWSTPRRARAAGAAQQARCMGGRSIAFRRPTLIDDYRRLL